MTVANLICLGYVFSARAPTNPGIPTLFGSVNVLGAVLVRNEMFLNGLYCVLVRACLPPRTPLRVKNGVTAGLLHLGGIHAGCAVSSVVWLVVALVSESVVDRQWGSRVLAGAVLLLLVIMCITAAPAVRAKHHNLFEYVHRFLGWSALLVLWTYLLLSIRWAKAPRESGLSMLTVSRSIAFWLTLLITALILSPWLTVRKVRVQATVTSPTVIEIAFLGTTGGGMFGRISRHLLSDWHSFALVSKGRRSASHTMVISAVGDFTRQLISAPPMKLYVRRLKFPGLPYCVPMYRRSIIIASGAGMAPYVSLLATLPRGRHQLIWIGRSFERYFGRELCDQIFQWPDLVLVDTTISGRPDLASLAVEHYREFKADVVFVGSNPEGTRQIVSGCRTLGIPAFGPSWDS